MNRRDFLKTSGLAAAGLSLDPRSASGADADVKLRITPVSLDIGPGKNHQDRGL